ncbi:hypothetical protein OHV05_35115 (plasmid) [Kitasatospora sp. NBC_00070]|uniref:hypothetical protein n=1 Tax=Kitasatospora sp. NBC_00070 TaxID=2975962 RepID=UPI002F907C47
MRGWLRRARRSAHQLWAVGVQAVVALDPSALPTLDRSTPLASAAWAPLAAALAAARRLGGEHHGLWPRIAVLHTRPAAGHGPAGLSRRHRSRHPPALEPPLSRPTAR